MAIVVATVSLFPCLRKVFKISLINTLLREFVFLKYFSATLELHSLSSLLKYFIK